MSYLGDYAEDYADLNFKFTTRRFSTGAPYALSGGTISVYKSNDATQSTAGVTLSADFDGVTGLNNVKIDLSADAFYATGKDYQVIITAGTVDSVSVVGECVASFSIENRFQEVDVVKLLGTAWLTPGTPGTPDVNVKLVSGDATAADNAEAFFDGTGYAGTNNVIPTVTTTTNLTNDPGGVTTLLSRLSSARAGYLDNLSGGAVALASQILDAAGIRTALGMASANLDTQIGLLATAAALATVAGYIDTEVAAIKAKTDNLPTDPADASDLAALLSAISAYIDTEVAAILSAVDTEVAAILEDTGTTLPAQIAALNNLSAAQVNAEVLDVLNVDTFAEPAQGTPGATITLAAKIGYLYKFLRNRKTQTATTKSIYNDDATTVDHKCTVADDGTTYSETEMTTGP